MRVLLRKSLPSRFSGQERFLSTAIAKLPRKDAKMTNQSVQLPATAHVSECSRTILQIIHMTVSLAAP